MTVFHKYTENKLDTIASQLLNDYEKIKVWCFFGEMGTGKTTLIKAIIKKWGNTAEAHSPTFSIVNQYLSNTHVPAYHFDFFRLNNLEEAIDIGIEDYFYSGNFCFCEWPEIVLPFLTKPYVQINIEGLSFNTRTLKAKINH